MSSDINAAAASDQPGEHTTHLSHKTLVTYYPLEAQKTFKGNKKRILNKPYVKYLRQNLYIYRDIVPAIQTPISLDKVLLLSDAKQLLESGCCKAENGWCALKDGTAYVSSLTRFPGTTGDMVRWWFWW